MHTSLMTGRSSLLPGIVILLAGCGGEPAHDAATEVVAVRRATLATDPAAPAWADVPAYRATLLVQDMVEPRLLAPGLQLPAGITTIGRSRRTARSGA